MAKISVVLATYNEAKNLPSCLESIKNLASEIVIVDGGSADQTVEIAKKYKAKVEITDNPQNFHINKQKAINLATKEWVLQLDADEKTTPELNKEISKIINDQNSCDGYWIPRKNWFLGRYLTKGGQYPDYTLRLYKNGKGKLPQQNVHEQAVVEGKVGYLKNPLLHMADPNLSRYFMRFNRYTDFIASDFKKNKIGSNPIAAFKYIIVMPTYWFFWTFFRHKGFVDSWQGFLFSFFSSLRFPVSYVKYLRSR